MVALHQIVSENLIKWAIQYVAGECLVIYVPRIIYLPI
jgi:hypothetical protein